MQAGKHSQDQGQGQGSTPAPGFRRAAPPAGGGRGHYKVIKGRRVRSQGTYPVAVRLKAVKLHLENGIPPPVVAQELGICRETITDWITRYQAEGEAGLYPKSTGTRRAKIAPALRDQVIEMKQQHPDFGVQRITDTLKRWFCLGVSSDTVRQTLHTAKLMDPPTPAKHRRNVTRPRFFERATPNQMWQSDIFTCPLGGKNGYVIGYLDDYSRYIVGLGLHRSQTATQVLEVYRRAAGEYGVPKEMLTDNGRQYASWRGNTAFQRELEKDQVKHIRSQPHHPMTLGKIERFWETMFQEFLARAQFDTFEEAQERLALWVKYYNHQRPHQGIGGLCPADRFFEIQHELKQVIERQVQENALELALRGKAQKPFYLVGRMHDQSVVLRAVKGKVVLSVNPTGQTNPDQSQEVVYDPREETECAAETESVPPAEPAAQQPGEGRGGAGGMDGETDAGGDRPGTGRELADSAELAGPGTDGYVGSPGVPGVGDDGEAADTEPAFAPTAGQAGPARAGSQGGEGRGRAGVAESAGGHVPGAATTGGDGEAVTTGGRLIATLDGEGAGGVSAAGRDHEGAGRLADGNGGGGATGDLAPALLRMGGAGAERGNPGAGGPRRGPAAQGGGPGEGAAATRGGDAGAGQPRAGVRAGGQPSPVRPEVSRGGSRLGPRQ